MKVEELTQHLQELESVDKADLSLEQRDEIASLYEYVLQKVFTPTTCRDCYHDAVVEMICYIRKHGGVKPRQLYRLKNGALLREGFGSGVFYTAETLTDEKAREFLRKDNSLLILFSLFPDNWAEDILEKPAESEETAKETAPASAEEAPAKVKRTRKRKN